MAGEEPPLLPLLRVVGEAIQSDKFHWKAEPLVLRLQPKEGRLLLFPGYFFSRHGPPRLDPDAYLGRLRRDGAGLSAKAR
jgi:hypothetical protein